MGGGIAAGPARGSRKERWGYQLSKQGANSPSVPGAVQGHRPRRGGFDRVLTRQVPPAQGGAVASKKVQSTREVNSSFCSGVQLHVPGEARKNWSHGEVTL